MGQAAADPFAGMSIPAEKAMNFRPSAKRLLGQLRPERLWLMLVLALAVAERDAVGDRAAAAGRGHQPDLRRRRVQAAAGGVSKEQLIAQLRAAGENQKADMLSAMALTPGTGIDFAALSSVLLWVLVLYVLASAFGWMQAYVLNGVVQRTVYRLRERDRGEDQPAAAALLRFRSSAASCSAG